MADNNWGNGNSFNENPYNGNQYGNNQNANSFPPGTKYVTYEKNVFTWVFCFLLGGFGVDRFVRGQVGLGVIKLLFGWATCGIWPLVDWIIALVKAYGSSYGNEANFVFINGNYSK